MIQSEDLRRLLKQEPFRPFRLHLTDGRTCEVRYPRLTLLGQSYIHVGIPEPGDTNPVYFDTTEFVLLSLIRDVEVLPEPAAPTCLRDHDREPRGGREVQAMVQSEDLRRLLKQEPFQPFRLHLTDGRTCDVRYPRLSLLGQTFIDVGIPDPENPRLAADGMFEFVLLSVIRDVEVLPEPAAPPCS